MDDYFQVLWEVKSILLIWIIVTQNHVSSTEEQIIQLISTLLRVSIPKHMYAISAPLVADLFLFCFIMRETSCCLFLAKIRMVLLE